jgi:hypothetical protein
LDAKQIAKENNKRVLERMRNPDDMLNTCEIEDIWFPKRPVDHEKIKRMKREKEDKKQSKEKKCF